MKRKLIKSFLFLLAIGFIFGCSSAPSPIAVTTPPEEFYLRDDAANTLIPLIDMYKWSYRINKGTEEKPTGPIKSLLDNDTISYIRILPVRQFDNNEGWGRYEYQALCYVTAKGKVFFYMVDRIYIGRHLQADNNGFESVIWDYELPTYCTENSSNYFVLNRNISSPNIKEDFLHEKLGYDTIDIFENNSYYQKHENCKLFEYQSKQNGNVRINRFYFKQGKGLLRYRQYVLSDTDSNLVLLYEQDLVESQ